MILLGSFCIPSIPQRVGPPKAEGLRFRVQGFFGFSDECVGIRGFVFRS